MSGIEDLNPSLASEAIEFDQEEGQSSPISPGEAGTAAGAPPNAQAPWGDSYAGVRAFLGDASSTQATGVPSRGDSETSGSKYSAESLSLPSRNSGESSADASSRRGSSDSQSSGSYSEGSLISGYRSSSGLGDSPSAGSTASESSGSSVHSAGGGPSRPLTRQNQLLDRIRRDSGSASSAYSFGSHSSDEKIRRPQDPPEKPLPDTPGPTLNKPLPDKPLPDTPGAHTLPGPNQFFSEVTQGVRPASPLRPPTEEERAMLDAGLAAQRNPSRLRNAFEGTPQQKAAGNAGENTRTTESMFAPGERPISSASSQEEQKPGLTQAEQNRINRMFAPEDD